MTQRFSRGLSQTLGFGCLLWAIVLAGCTGVESTPAGAPPEEDKEMQSEEYLKGEKAIE